MARIHGTDASDAIRQAANIIDELEATVERLISDIAELTKENERLEAEVQAALSAD